VLLSAVLTVAVFAGCTRKPSSPVLSGAVYASQIPVYPGAVLEDTGGGNYYEDLGGAPTFESKSWFFKVNDSVTLVTAFYENRLPDGSRNDDEGVVAFKVKPKGAEEGEEISARIEPGKLHVTEVVKPGKRKA
jgi:hypothetical protein